MSANMGNESDASPDSISIAGALVKIGVIIAVSALFNYYPDKVGVLESITDPSSFTPLLTPDFRPYLSWLNLWWGAALALHGVNLVARRWNVATRLVDIVIRLLSVWVLGWMALGVPFIAQPVAAVAARLGLAVACLLSFFEAVKQFNRLLISRNIYVESKRARDRARR